MKNKKRKIKEIVVLITLFLVLCGGVVTGVTLFNQRNNDQVSNDDTHTKEPVKKPEVSKVSSNQYTVIVKSDTGVVLPNVLVSIYDAEGNMVTAPQATDAVGRLMYTSEEEGTYGACVLAAPFQYALDRQIYYFETGEKILNIVLKEDPKAYVARIGDTNYTLRGALTAANASTEDVTITLLHDVYVVSDLYFNNKSGKTITLDGAGKTVTYLAKSSMFPISQKAGTVNFKNLKLVHNGGGAVFRTSNAINLNLTDITILAQNDTEGFYKWSLINLFGAGKTNLTMTRVKIDMDITTIESDAAAAVIRTGNVGNVKDIKITMNDCYIDATGAKGRAGIRVTEDTAANVVFNNTTFLTQNNYVVAVDGQLEWSQTNSTLGSKDAYYNAHPIPEAVATVGSEKYYSLSTAVKKASKLGGKEPVKLIADTTLFKTTTFSGDGITAIIDGNGHTLTTEGGNTIFKVNGNNYKLTFRNMTINHGAYDRLLQYEDEKENIDVTWENVKVVASGTSETACYRYGLVNLRGSGTFTMKSSSITLDVPKIIKGVEPGVIRTGNANDGQKLTICLDNSKIDVSATSGAYGIYVQKGVTANVVLKNYEIHTKDKFPVYVHADDGDATLTYDNMTTWSCKSASVGSLCNLMSLMKLEDAAKIGDTVYKTLSEAFKAANAASGDVAITLLRDCIISEKTTFDKANSNITVDGGGKYSLITTGSALMFVLDNDNVGLTFKDLVIAHRGYDRFVTFNKKNVDKEVYKGVNVVFDNVKMNASGTSDSKCYPYGIFNLRASGAFTMIDSTITLDVEKVFGGNGYGVIRLGNADDGQNVEITMKNSTIDASQTKDIAGIYVQKGSTVPVETSNSTIKTNNKYPIFVNSTGALTLAQTDSNWSCATDTIKSITNCEAKIGNDYYLTLTDAWVEAKSKGGTTTITMTRDCTLDQRLHNVEIPGTCITIDGQKTGPGTGYTLTTEVPADKTDGVRYGNVMTINPLKDEHKININFQNMNIVHKSENPLVAMNNKPGYKTSVQLNVNNVDIDVCYDDSNKKLRSGLFNLRDDSTILMTDVNVTVNSPSSDAENGIIRTGNKGDGATVYARLQNCNLDTKLSPNVSIAKIHSGNTLNITCQGSTLKTAGAYIFNTKTTDTTFGNLTATVDQFTAGAAEMGETTTLDPQDVCKKDGPNYTATTAGASINGFLYADLMSAMEDAQKFDGSVTVKMLADATFTAKCPISTAYANVTVDGYKADGGKYKVTANYGTANTVAFEISNNNITFTLQGMEIDYTGNRRVLLLTQSKATTGKSNRVGVSINMHDLVIEASSTANNYGVIDLRGNADLYMTDVYVDYANTTAKNGLDYAIIRGGNATKDDGTKTITATLENCHFNQNATTKGSIFSVNQGATMNVTARECEFKTNNSNLVFRHKPTTPTNDNSITFNWGAGTTWTNDGTTWTDINPNMKWVNTEDVADGHTCEIKK